MTTEETMKEYTSTRMRMYIEKARAKNWKKGEEEKLYDNIMELISMHDYCFVGLSIADRQLLDDVKSYHELNAQLKELTGMIL